MSRPTKRLKRAAPVLMLSTLALLVGGARPALAADSASKYGCEVHAYSPYTYTSGGKKYAAVSVYVHCSVGRSVLTRARIMEADPGPDDTVAPWAQQPLTDIEAGQTRKVGTVSGECKNFDEFGAEELYSQSQVWVGGVWSDTAQSAEVSTSC